MFVVRIAQNGMGEHRVLTGIIQAQCDDADIAKKVEAGIDIIVAAHTKSKKETLEVFTQKIKKKCDLHDCARVELD
jgi:hypothetical protein